MTCNWFWLCARLSFESRLTGSGKAVQRRDSETRLLRTGWRVLAHASLMRKSRPILLTARFHSSRVSLLWRTEPCPLFTCHRSGASHRKQMPARSCCVLATQCSCPYACVSHASVL